MNLLALDTTTKILTLAVLRDGSRAEYNLEAGRRLSGLLEPSIKRVTDAAGLPLKSVDYFCVGLGPGSFTGMRIGIACVKGLAWSLNKPVVGVSTLDILARNAEEDAESIIPAVDARRNLIYCSVYKKKGAKLKRVKPYMLVNLKEFLKLAGGNSLILGDAAGIYREAILGQVDGARIADLELWWPRAHNLIELSLERIKESKASDTFNIKPIYLYPKECQIKNT
jgi:tRNA threonylcarbamoyladenosine biosynthesis protein TsaB